MDYTNDLPITRKAAIYQAISLLEKQQNRAEEIALLKELATGLPIVQWSSKVAKDCIDDFYIENNRFPTVTELQRREDLPSHTNFKYLFGITARQWFDENSSSYVVPKTTRKRVLMLAAELLEGEEQNRVLEMLDEYPVTKWNELNMLDCLLTFYEKYNRVPSEDEMEESDELPYYGIFKYKWKTSYLKWLEIHIPFLYKEFFDERIFQRDYVTEFVSEYNRLSPRNEADFDRRRDPNKCCQVCHIKASLNITRWAQLVEYCGLKLFDIEAERIAKERAKIKSVKMVDVDCGENFFFRVYSKKLERDLEALMSQQPEGLPN